MNHSNCIKTFFHIWAFLDLLRNISAKKFSKTKVAKKSVKDFLATEVDQICKKEKKQKKKQLFQGYFFLTESFRFLQPFWASFAPTRFPFSWLQHHNLKCTFSVTHELWTFLVKKREDLWWAGFEPMTSWLQGICSATEPRQRLSIWL